VTYPRFPPTQLSPNGRERASGISATQLSVSYDSGAGNGIFGLGWNLALPSITRKTDKGLPRYWDSQDFDVFILSGAEDLVPVLKDGNIDELVRDGYHVRRYRQELKGCFPGLNVGRKLRLGRCIGDRSQSITF
jgi:Salmonella virulence plasmid 65kDa B protein